VNPRWAWLGLIALCGYRLWIASRVPLLPDEAYYWVWSRTPSAGYFDHPPMVALWIRFGTWAAGQTELGVRLLGPLSELAASWLLAQAARDLLPGADPKAGIVAALLMNATLFWGVAGEVMTPDVPLLFFWVLTIWALGRLVATGQKDWWLWAGIAAGLAMDSKYTAVLLPTGILIWLLAPERRFWWRSPWVYGGALLALALFTPVMLWNYDHHWASFVRQGGRVADFSPARMLGFEAELIGGQLLLATPVVAILCAWGAVIAARRWREPGMGLFAAMIWPGVALFAEHALGDRVQANWPAVIYPAAAIAAAGLAWRSYVMRLGIWLGLMLGTLALAQVAFGLVKLPRSLAALPLSPGTVPEFVRTVTRETGNARYIATDDYGLAALMAFYLPGDIEVAALGDRWREFDLPAVETLIRTSPGTMMVRARANSVPGWAVVSPLAPIPSARGNQTEMLYALRSVMAGPWSISGALMPRREKSRGG